MHWHFYRKLKILGIFLIITSSLLFGIFYIRWIRYLHGDGSPITLGNVVNHVTTSEKVVALTYDDGPNPPYTDQILATLRTKKVPATFFVLGKNLEQHPEYMKKIIDGGHEVGNHSWSHQLLIFKRPSTVRQEIEKTDNLIRSLGYNKEILFRAPYGTGFIILPWILSSMHKKQISFDVIARDWNSKNVDTIVQRVISNVKPGSIILLHDGGGDRSKTVKACKKIIDALHNQGYRFATISELLGMQK